MNVHINLDFSPVFNLIENAKYGLIYLEMLCGEVSGTQFLGPHTPEFQRGVCSSVSVEWRQVLSSFRDSGSNLKLEMELGTPLE